MCFSRGAAKLLAKEGGFDGAVRFVLQYAWADAWDRFESPQARAYSLLKELDLGCSLDAKGENELCRWVSPKKGRVGPGMSHSRHAPPPEGPVSRVSPT